MHDVEDRAPPGEGRKLCAGVPESPVNAIAGDLDVIERDRLPLRCEPLQDAISDDTVHSSTNLTDLSSSGIDDRCARWTKVGSPNHRRCSGRVKTLNVCAT